MKLSTIFSALNTLNLNVKETAMKKLISLAAIMAVIPALTTSTTAFAQTPTASASASFNLTTPPAAPAPAASPLFVLKSWPEWAEFAQFVSRYYSITIQATYVERAKGSARDTFTEEKKTVKSLDVERLMGQFSILFPEFQGVLKGEGEKVPATMLTAFTAYLKANGCEQTGEEKVSNATFATWSPGCKPLYDNVVAVFTAKVSKAKASDYTENAKHILALSKKYEGAQAIVMAHGALIALTSQLPESERPWALLGNDYLNGRDVCVQKKVGTDKVCGKIEKIDQDGVTINGVAIPLDDIRTLCFGTADECKDMGKGGSNTSFASQHPVSLELRGFYRAGSAEQFASPAMGGVMLVGRLNLMDNLSVHGGLGMGSLDGRSQFGVYKADSPTVFVGMLGASALLGSVSWPVAPILEANATFQGVRPGVEGGLGAHILPSKPLNFRVMGTLGYYPTGKQLFTHPDKPTADYNLFGVGVVVGAAYTF